VFQDTWHRAGLGWGSGRAGVGVREGNNQIGGQKRATEGELGSAAVVQFLRATDHELSLEQSMRILKYLRSTRA